MNNRLPYTFHHHPPRPFAPPVFAGVNPAFLLRPLPPRLRPVLTLPDHHHHLPKSDSNHQQQGIGLQIRGLSPSVGYLEREHLLYGLGATTVHNAPFYSIAFFSTEKAAQAVIRRLHQQPWAGTNNSSSTASTNRRLLRVEYLQQPKSTKPELILNAHRPCDSSLKRLITAEQQQCFNLNQQPSPSSSSPLETSNQFSGSFRFPPATPSVVRRISRSLLANDCFYEQVLLLMLKLGLHPPFDADNHSEEEEDCGVNLDYIKLPPSPQTSKRPLDDHSLLASDESELEESEDAKASSSNHLPTFHHQPKRRKRKRLKTGLVGEKAQDWLAKSPSKSNTLLTTTIEEVFEGGEVLQQRDLKIKVAPLVLPSSPLESQPESKSESFGTLSPQLPKPTPPAQSSISFDLATLTSEDLVSDEELANNLVPRTEWPQHKVFAGYQNNPICNRLYVKNLHRSTSLKDLYRLFGKFIGSLTDTETLKSFHIVKLDRGRMRGQAFVTFPTEEAAKEALQRTNGYALHRDEETGQPRPIVVNFALSKKSEVVESVT